MGGRARGWLAAAVCATALGALGTSAWASAPLTPNTNWSALLPALPGNPTEPQPGPVQHCRTPSMACMDGVVRRLQRLRQRFRCDHRGVFATTYLELSRELRRALDEEGFFDYPDYLQTQATSFVAAYFDAVEAWERGEPVAPAWRIAFEQAASGQITGAQEMLLGINAHVQNDMAFVIADLGVRAPDGSSRKPDHEAVNEVLNRAYGSVVREVRERYDSTMSITNTDLVTVDDVAGLEMARGWREIVWRNAERLLNARNAAHRARVAKSIQANAAMWARGISLVQAPGIRAQRDAYCAVSFPTAGD
jgi:hypothetical protein